MNAVKVDEIYLQNKQLFPKYKSDIPYTKYYILLTMGTNVGYSGRALKDKLGIKSGMKLLVINTPTNYRTLVPEIPSDLHIAQNLVGTFDYIHYFADSQHNLTVIFPRLVAALNPDAMLWVSWTKRAANSKSSLTENTIRRIGLSHGVVDIKVCAIDETWSALKFVIPLKNR